MNDDILIEKAFGFIKDKFENDFSGHDYHHSVRVFRLATTICKAEQADQKIVQLASLLHDVDDYKVFGGNSGGFSNAESFLESNGADKSEIAAVCEIISKISFKSEGTQIPSSLEGKIVQDADRLDAIGAIGIARVFAYGGNKHRILHAPDIKPVNKMNTEQYVRNNGTSINHFYEKLFKLKSLMNTPTARTLAESRHNYMESFLKEFYEEWDGAR